ncbi:hypothetical protein B0H11DRAFT_2227634 [Mycena galericulata]|nr:hypothetical protein B0H11DRAFT_2227634 [Mycena galericulata]
MPWYATMGKGDLVLGSPRANASASELPQFYPAAPKASAAVVIPPHESTQAGRGWGTARRFGMDTESDAGTLPPSRLLPLARTGPPAGGECRPPRASALTRRGQHRLLHMHAHQSSGVPGSSPRERTQRKRERLASLTRAYRRLVPRYRTARLYVVHLAHPASTILRRRRKRRRHGTTRSPSNPILSPAPTNDKPACETARPAPSGRTQTLHPYPRHPFDRGRRHLHSRVSAARFRTASPPCTHGRRGSGRGIMRGVCMYPHLDLALPHAHGRHPRTASPPRAHRHRRGQDGDRARRAPHLHVA